jgi:hypothetical protein
LHRWRKNKNDRNPKGIERSFYDTDDLGESRVIVFLLAIAVADDSSITVDCNKGQSLNQALAKLDKHTSATVSVKGTCTEYVLVDGFENLKLPGLQGATLQQQITDCRQA